MQRLPSVILLLLLYVTAPQAGESTGSPVSRAVFTTAIENTEPVDSFGVLHSDAQRVFLFTEFRNMDGDAAVHTWEYKGAVVARVKFRVSQPNARLWSCRQLTPDLKGSWRVVVTNASGTVLAEKTLDYNPDDLPF